MLALFLLLISSYIFSQEVQPHALCTDINMFKDVQKIIDINYHICESFKWKKSQVIRSNDARNEIYFDVIDAIDGYTSGPLKQGLIISFFHHVKLHTPWGSICLLAPIVTPCGHYGTQSVDANEYKTPKNTDNEPPYASLIACLRERIKISLRENKRARNKETDTFKQEMYYDIQAIDGIATPEVQFHDFQEERYFKL